jgi:hypothetical protein
MNIYDSWNQKELPIGLWTTKPKESKKTACYCGQVYIDQMIHHTPTSILEHIKYTRLENKQSVKAKHYAAIKDGIKSVRRCRQYPHLPSSHHQGGNCDN